MPELICLEKKNKRQLRKRYGLAAIQLEFFVETTDILLIAASAHKVTLDWHVPQTAK